ncbi:MAG: 2-oxo acid dehydrogenase subunit E2 [Rhizobiales bacterium]|nr:2-oxo acid dehydrogenase subunit E2 [Hyphomicrobiales bacterium]
MTDFRMPSLGADMEEGTLVEWLKQPGDQLHRGDIIAVVETQKGAIEIEVFHDGVLEKTHANPGTRLPVGTLLATIRGEGEAPGPPLPSAAPAELPRAPSPPPPRAIAPQPSARRKITPAALRRAIGDGLDIATLTPGPDGIIGLRELAQAPAPPKRRTGGINLDEMRKAIAAAMARSKREIPHYYVSSTIDMTPMVDWLSAENARRPAPDRILSAVPVIKACALALRKVPGLNGHFIDGRYVADDSVKMGVGIALHGGGLIAPALDGSDTMSLGDIMQRLSDLVARVRGGRLRSSELTDATVTLSNLGDESADTVLPVIYPPQVAIIGVGEIVERPWVVNGALTARKLATFTVAGDHRANDGRIAARFLKVLGQVLQTPEAL